MEKGLAILAGEGVEVEERGHDAALDILWETFCLPCGAVQCTKMQFAKCCAACVIGLQVPPARGTAFGNDYSPSALFGVANGVQVVFGAGQAY